jgi:crossover junction endodeoxyribonuclease RusA
VTTTIRLPYANPPLRSNDRGHWAPRAQQTKAVRSDAAWMAADVVKRDGAIRGPVVVTLIWEVMDNRVRDVGAAAPTCKAAIDGLVDAGLLPSDSHRVVTEERYRIEVGDRRGVRLEIERTDA